MQTRDEVDADRFGVTGRSGGGIYTWWVAALDDRVKVAVPVAGITTLRNYVVDGCVEGHCDCMFMVNTYRWDYPKVAALVAPRPLLISNSDKDRIFPLDGVVELHRQVRDVYRLYGAEDKLGLQITEGPHNDTQNLRVHAFNWMNRFLKNDDEPIRMVADKSLHPSELKVFTDSLPDDEIVTMVDELFIATADPNELPKTSQELERQAKRWIETLRQKTFGGWPMGASDDADVKQVRRVESGSINLSYYEFNSTPPYRLPFYVLEHDSDSQAPDRYRVELLDQADWDEISAAISDPSDADTPSILSKRMSDDPGTEVILFPPRGIGPTRWSDDPVVERHVRRRFLLLGQTDDSMRIYDVCRLLNAIRNEPKFHGKPIELAGRSRAAVWALYAALLSDREVFSLTLIEPPPTHGDAVTLLNVTRHVEMPQVVAAARTKVTSLRIFDDVEALETWRPILENGLAYPEQLSLLPPLSDDLSP